MKKLLQFVWKMTQLLLILVVLPTMLMYFFAPAFADITLGILLMLWGLGGIIAAVVWVIIAVVRGSDSPKAIK